MEEIKKYIGKIGKGIATTALAGYLALGSIGQAKAMDPEDIAYFDAVERKEGIEQKVIELCTDREFLKQDIATFGDYYGTLDSLTKVLEGYDAKIDSVGKILVESDKETYKLGKEAQKRGKLSLKRKIKREYFPVEDFCEKFDKFGCHYYPTK